jgi:hypothetical protein
MDTVAMMKHFRPPIGKLKRRIWHAFLVRSPDALLTTTEIVRLVYPRIRDGFRNGHLVCGRGFEMSTKGLLRAKRQGLQHFRQARKASTTWDRSYRLLLRTFGCSLREGLGLIQARWRCSFRPRRSLVWSISFKDPRTSP